jgi:hypothetical protein
MSPGSEDSVGSGVGKVDREVTVTGSEGLTNAVASDSRSPFYSPDRGYPSDLVLERRAGDLPESLK